MAQNIANITNDLLGITYDDRGATMTKVTFPLSMDSAIGGVQTLPSGTRWGAFAYGNNHGMNVRAMHAAHILGHVAHDDVNTMTDPDDALMDQIVFLGISDDGKNIIDLPMEVVNTLLNIGLNSISLDDLRDDNALTSTRRAVASRH